MVGSTHCAPGFDIHVDSSTLVGERPCCKDVIEAPAFVLLERARTKIIPECEKLFVGIKVSKDIDETPRDSIFVCVTYTLVKANVPEMLLRAVHVDWFGRDIHIAAPQCRLIC